MLNEELDAHGRPAQKIALLCGPPGLGKTTLAHIIAKHAGEIIVFVLSLCVMVRQNPEFMNCNCNAYT